jgi:membrane protease YdiL (CAAX protease family)
MYLPGIPAYIWLWPRVSGSGQTGAQVFAYVYFLAGTLLIGSRHWRLSDLGLNRQGLAVSLTCGGAILVGRVLITLSVGWYRSSVSFSWLRFAGDVLFYVGLVGVSEELLFRGLIYHALEVERGTRLAIWGSTLAFALDHVPSQGPLGGLGMIIIGGLFAAIRWRAGGILGLIFVHGAIDIAASYMLPSLNASQLVRPAIINPGEMLIGCALLFLMVPVYLWRLYPWPRKPLSVAPGNPASR